MREVWAEAARLAAKGEAFAVATVVKATGSVPGKAGFKMLVRADGSTVGTVGGAGLEERVKALARQAIAGRRKSDLARFDLATWKPEGLDSVCGGTVEVAIEVVLPVPHLLLAGGGHVGLAMAEGARLLGWPVTVLDDRAEYVARERFPHATRIQAGPEWFGKADLSPFSHLLLLGYSWRVDTEILKHVLPRFPGTIGVIGSKAKWGSMSGELARAGVAEADLARVRTPIGLDIGAETPAEIAVAVLAQIIETERSK